MRGKGAKEEEEKGETPGGGIKGEPIEEEGEKGGEEGGE